MSFSHSITVWCDECSVWETIGTQFKTVATTEVRKKGWIKVKKDHFCPECVKNNKVPKVSP